MRKFRYTGMIPALKYIVITRNLYHSFLCHISCLVTRYPARAEASTMRNVPISVLETDTRNAFPRSLT